MAASFLFAVRSPDLKESRSPDGYFADSGSSGPDSSTALCSWARHFTLIVPFFTQVYTVNSRLASTPLIRTVAITDKIQIPIYRGLTANDSRYYGLSLYRTHNDVPNSSAITRVDCKWVPVNLRLGVALWQTSILAYHPGEGREEYT